MPRTWMDARHRLACVGDRLGPAARRVVGEALDHRIRGQVCALAVGHQVRARAWAAGGRGNVAPRGEVEVVGRPVWLRDYHLARRHALARTPARARVRARRTFTGGRVVGAQPEDHAGISTLRGGRTRADGGEVRNRPGHRGRRQQEAQRGRHRGSAQSHSRGA
jgi:hypothetical protein